SSYNKYLDIVGKTFEDIDGYRIVLQNKEWNA
ncbi:VOC family protein, partial [Aliivibrio fischeri]|nr:VOC family protein [Aliivibrio fischeri]